MVFDIAVSLWPCAEGRIPSRRLCRKELIFEQSQIRGPCKGCTFRTSVYGLGQPFSEQSSQPRQPNASHLSDPPPIPKAPSKTPTKGPLKEFIFFASEFHPAGAEIPPCPVRRMPVCRRSRIHRALIPAGPYKPHQQPVSGRRGAFCAPSTARLHGSCGLPISNERRVQFVWTFACALWHRRCGDSRAPVRSTNLLLLCILVTRPRPDRVPSGDRRTALLEFCLRFPLSPVRDDQPFDVRGSVRRARRAI
jgi:hypothetical protein